jgi:hypothetical protein
MQLLFFPFPPSARERVRTLVSAIAKPLGDGLGALVLLAVTPAAQTAAPGPALTEQAARLGLCSLPLGLITIALIPLVRRGYFDAMRRTLIRRELDTASVVYGPQTRAILRAARLDDERTPRAARLTIPRVLARLSGTHLATTHTAHHGQAALCLA